MSNELWLYDVLFSFRSLFISRLCLVFRFIKTMTSLSIRFVCSSVQASTWNFWAFILHNNCCYDHSRGWVRVIVCLYSS